MGASNVRSGAFNVHTGASNVRSRAPLTSTSALLCSAGEIKASYKAAVGAHVLDGKRPFLIMAAAIMERVAATDVLAKALERRDLRALGDAMAAARVVSGTTPRLANTLGGKKIRVLYDILYNYTTYFTIITYYTLSVLYHVFVLVILEQHTRSTPRLANTLGGTETCVHYY